MTLKTFVIDDEFFAVEILADHISRTPGLVLAGSSTDPLQALQDLNATSTPEIAFIDVEMPTLNGLAFAKLLDRETKIVFTTSHRHFGPEAFELGAADYLLKPVTYERFLTCVNRIRANSFNKEKDDFKEHFSFFVKADMKGKLVRIVADDILYISSEQNYVNIHLSGEKIKAYLTLTELLERLPLRQFCRTHRAYIVNIDRVRIMEPGILRLSDHSVIDIGPKYKDELLQRLKSKIIISHRH